MCDGTDVFVPGIMELSSAPESTPATASACIPLSAVGDKAKRPLLDTRHRSGLASASSGYTTSSSSWTTTKTCIVIEVNPRSSRTVPFLSKASGYQLADIATLAILGKTLKEQGILALYPEEKKRWYVKVPAFSFSKLSGMDTYLSPEMKSTGEAIGYDQTLTRALFKALQASGMRGRQLWHNSRLPWRTRTRKRSCRLSAAFITWALTLRQRRAQRAF